MRSIERYRSGAKALRQAHAVAGKRTLAALLHLRTEVDAEAFFRPDAICFQMEELGTRRDRSYGSVLPNDIAGLLRPYISDGFVEDGAVAFYSVSAYPKELQKSGTGGIYRITPSQVDRVTSLVASED